MGNLTDDRKLRTAAVAPSRRAFLRGVSGSGLALGALVVGADAEASEPSDSEPQDGYRENEHILRYYQLSRF